jgi:hypothetical protein
MNSGKIDSGPMGKSWVLLRDFLGDPLALLVLYRAYGWNVFYTNPDA